MIFLYESKLCHKEEMATHNISSAFDQRIAYKCTMQRWFRKFRNVDESFEEICWRPLAIENDELKWLIQVDPHQRFECNVRHKSSSSYGSPQVSWKIEKDQQMSAAWIEGKWKVYRYEVYFVLLWQNNNNPFLNCIVTCNEIWNIYDNDGA